MSVYKGVWPDKVILDKTDIEVTVDGQPLPVLSKDVIGTEQVFGWGNFSRWVEKKMLAYSILHYELEKVMGVSETLTQHYTLLIDDAFVDDPIAKLAKEWSMTSDDIRQWIKARYPKIWQDIASNLAVQATSI